MSSSGGLSGRRCAPLGVEGRGGIHTEEVERIIEKIGGIAVCIRAHVAILAQPGGR